MQPSFPLAGTTAFLLRYVPSRIGAKLTLLFLLLKETAMRRIVCLMIVLAVNTKVWGYSMQGLDVVVDYWAGSGSNETIVVFDWNLVNGPYATESHAWGFRWDGAAYVSDALSAIDAAGTLNITTQYGGGFLGDAYYNNPSIDSDNHTSAGFTGWWWAGDTINGGANWMANTEGLNVTSLANGKIEGFNLVTNYDEWLVGDTTLTIPVPEPCTIAILGLGGLLLRKGKHNAN
jgi:hypothetical protein